jgi:nucleoid-associated protein YgaU
VLVWLAGWALAGGAGWLGLVAAAVALASVPGTRAGRDDGWIRALPMPDAWRRLVLLLCGVAAVSSVAVPAHADARHVPPPMTATEGLPLPSRPAGRFPVPTATRARVVTVRPGDCLWRLATATLPASAGTGRVADLVRRTYAGNRAVIGDDPDLLQPGTRLVLLLPTDERHRR